MRNGHVRFPPIATAKADVEVIPRPWGFSGLFEMEGGGARWNREAGRDPYESTGRTFGAGRLFEEGAFGRQLDVRQACVQGAANALESPT